MKANINDLKVFGKIPKEYNNTDSYDLLNEKHYDDGWRDVVKPTLKENEKLGSIYFDEVNDVITYNVVTLTSEELKEKKKSYTRDKYELHKFNGWGYYQEFRSDVVLSVEDEEITEEKAFEIESFLGDVFDKISNTGDWKTALFLLSQKTTEDSVLLSYKNKALTDIQDYINNNYDS